MKNLILILVTVSLMMACSKNESTPVVDNNYDKTALLTNWADNIITPSYVNFQSKMNELKLQVDTFILSPNQTSLNSLRTSWVEAYKAYQYVAIYNFGKSEDISFKESINIFPTDVAGINANIVAGTYNLNAANQADKQGFPALDYLINGLSTTDAAIIGFYSSNTNALNYKKYLKDLTLKIKNNADSILSDWNINYRNSYIASSGTSVTASINITTNEFVKNLEKDIRTSKIDYPAGLFSNGTLYANKVEGFYKNDISKMLLIESIKASQDFFNGKHFNSSTIGLGLKSYLDFLNATRANQKLSDIINNQYTSILGICNTLNNSLSQQVMTDNSKMLATNVEIQKNVVYTKLDMMQALNISIDYVDGDGD